ncbi:hypothetical protein V6Z12_D03G118900 [Gossypium hirsutum]
MECSGGIIHKVRMRTWHSKGSARNIDFYIKVF